MEGKGWKITFIAAVCLTVLAIIAGQYLWGPAAFPSTGEPKTGPVSIAGPTAAPTPTPEPTPTPAPTPDPIEARAQALADGMTLEEAVGQLFFVRCPDNAAEEEAAYGFGGYLLFGRDFDGLTKDQVRENIEAYQAAAKVPMLIGVDEEGGTVVRISSNPALCDEPFWSPRALYDAGGMDLVLYAEDNKCQIMKELGVNVNFAPVCDVSLDPWDFMYERSLGQPPEITAEYARRVAAYYRERRLGCVLKHFPGYGDNSDTHTGVAYDQRPWETFSAADLLPFAGGIEGGAGCVLVSHNIVSCRDAEKPASLSEEWHMVLREEMSFAGCIITDDLSMEAIRQYCDTGFAAVQAIKAGNDLLCCTDYEVQFPAVIEAVNTGELSEARIRESARRVLIWKIELGLL